MTTWDRSTPSWSHSARKEWPNSSSPSRVTYPTEVPRRAAATATLEVSPPQPRRKVVTRLRRPRSSAANSAIGSPSAITSGTVARLLDAGELLQGLADRADLLDAGGHPPLRLLDLQRGRQHLCRLRAGYHDYAVRIPHDDVAEMDEDAAAGHRDVFSHGHVPAHGGRGDDRPGEDGKVGLADLFDVPHAGVQHRSAQPAGDGRRRHQPAPLRDVAGALGALRAAHDEDRKSVVE